MSRIDVGIAKNSFPPAVSPGVDVVPRALVPASRMLVDSNLASAIFVDPTAVLSPSGIGRQLTVEGGLQSRKPACRMPLRLILIGCLGK
jgi:hypothetical protein